MSTRWQEKIPMMAVGNGKYADYHMQVKREEVPGAKARKKWRIRSGVPLTQLCKNGASLFNSTGASIYKRPDAMMQFDLQSLVFLTDKPTVS